jgi:hypothetical protein
VIKPGRRWKDALGRWLVSAGLAGGAGCMSVLHPVNPPGLEQRAACQAQLTCAKDHVYIFFVGGLDPLNYANLTGVRDYINELGFNKTYLGQLYHVWYLDKQIHHIHETDPEARFVLVGFSFGANMVRDLAHWAAEGGTTIDLLVYLGGNTLENCPEDQPDNAIRIINILASGCIWNGDHLDRAENLHLTDVWHFGSPSHPTTLNLLAHGLAEVAARVPVPAPREEAPVPAEEVAPTPRPVMPRAASHRPGWDFLKPVSRLRIPGAPDPSVPKEEPKPKQPDPERIAQN